MIYLYLITILIIMFIISINRKRVMPNSVNNSHNYITSPIDGKITDIHLVEVNSNDEKKIFTEIVIQTNIFSPPYLYAPFSGTMKVIERNLDNFIIDFFNESTNVKISHGWNSIINQMNYPILKSVKTYSGDYFRAGDKYGRALFIHYIKILIPTNTDEKNYCITASIGQHVIGGESIISHN